MCGGTAGTMHDVVTKKWRKHYKDTFEEPTTLWDSHAAGAQSLAEIFKETGALGMFDSGKKMWGMVEDEHEGRKQDDTSTPEDTSQVDSYAMSNTGIGVGDPKKRTRKHGMRQNILTSGQGLN